MKIEGYKKIKNQNSDLVRDTNLKRQDEVRTFLPMPKLKILCGKNGGLPFEYLMTDVISGCLPIKKICYGNCSAADFWFDKGFDFGKRVTNEFDEQKFRDSILLLPKSQKWLRQGWASDCSFSDSSWELVATAAEILCEYEISLLIITKAYHKPTKEILKRLSNSNAELRTSISATDNPKQLDDRLELMYEFREQGGKSVPYLMSAKYADTDLAVNQSAIVKFIVVNDFIAAEHPLRFNSDNHFVNHLDSSGFWHPKFPDQYWFGRIYSEIPNFILPPPTHLLPEYTLKYRSLSEVIKINGLDGNLPTFQDLKDGGSIHIDNLFKHATYDSENN